MLFDDREDRESVRWFAGEVCFMQVQVVCVEIVVDRREAGSSRTEFEKIRLRFA